MIRSEEQATGAEHIYTAMHLVSLVSEKPKCRKQFHVLRNKDVFHALSRHAGTKLKETY
jgi:hypothetical protein